MHVLFGLIIKNRINEFTIGYMNNPGLNVKKAFREQLENFMNTTFGEITQHFIKSTQEKIIQVCYN